MTIALNSLLHCEQEVADWLKSWLLNEGPITPRLHEESGNAALQVISQEWIPSMWWEQEVIHAKPKQRLLRRDITISSHGTLAWYARTYIPDDCYDLEPAFFEQLDKVSMAKLVFDEPRVKRLQLFYYPIKADCLEFYWLPETMQQEAEIWVRAACFEFRSKGVFYLLEFFSENLKMLTGHIND